MRLSGETKLQGGWGPVKEIKKQATRESEGSKMHDSGGKTEVSGALYPMLGKN